MGGGWLGGVLQELVNLHNRSLPTQTFDWQEGKVMNDKMAHTSDKDLENYILNFVKRINYYDKPYDDWLLRWYLCEMLSHPSLQCRAVSADCSGALCFVKLWLRLSQFSADLSQMPARSDPSQSSVTASQPASQQAEDVMMTNIPPRLIKLSTLQNVPRRASRYLLSLE